MAKKQFEFTDQDKLIDILHSTKQMQNIYNTYSTEASNSDIEEVLEELYLGMKDQSRSIFNLLYSKGWYKLENEDKAKINSAVTKCEQDKKEIF